MTADVSKPTHAWPFMTAGVNTTDPERIQLAVLELLRREGRAMHTGELATVLKVPTSQIFTAMHHPQQTGKVRFVSSEGWTLPAPPDKSIDDRQERLA